MRFSPSLRAAAAAVCLLFSTTFSALANPIQKKKSPKPALVPAATRSAFPAVNRRVPFGSRVARQALSYRGVPYRFGGQSRKGIDCSALIQSAYKKWGILLPRTSVAQHQQGVSVSRSQMKPGDLVFFKNTYKRGISHVGIYIGEHKFVHASSGKSQVTVSSLGNPYYFKHWAGARRITLEPGRLTPTPGMDSKIGSLPSFAANSLESIGAALPSVADLCLFPTLPAATAAIGAIRIAQWSVVEQVTPTVTSL